MKLHSDLQYSYDAEMQRLAIVFRSGELLYRIHFGSVGFNRLPNFIGIDKSSDGQAWIAVNASTTDWLPPLRVAAVHNGDGSGKFATGGNHGNVDKSAKGDRTGRNVIFHIRADGHRISQSISGYAETIDILVMNEVMGWNTTRVNPRYTMRQTFQLTFRAGCCEVQAHLEALEDVWLARDSALQCVTVGFQEHMCFYGKGGKLPYADFASCGARADAPHVIGVGLFSEEHGQMAMWLDREWEAGSGSMLLSAHPHVRISGNKAYLAVALDVDENQRDIQTTVTLSAGQAYRYRGGYSWHAPEKEEGMECGFYYYRNGKACHTFVTLDGKLVTV